MRTDLRLAVRSLRRAPAFAIAAIACVAIAVGANTTIFSVVSGVLLRPLPYPEADRLAVLYALKDGGEPNSASPGDFLDWRARSRSFATMGVVHRTDAPLTEAGDPAMLEVDRVSPEVFDALGVRPRLGRVIEAADAAPGEPVVVLSEGLWRSRFGGRADAIGSMVTLGGDRVRVVGVMPAGFRTVNDEADAWSALVLPPGVDWRAVSGRFVYTVGKLAPGVTMAQAQRELDGIAQDIAREHPEFNSGWGVSVVGMREVLVGDVRKPLAVLMGAVAMVLLIACANVANLQLVRATARAQEFAVRGALGAARGRLVRQLLTESLVIAAAGGAIGLLAASYATSALVRSAPDLPFAAGISIDLRVLAFTLVLTTLTGILFGLVPAFGATRLRLSDVLRQGGRGSAGSARRGVRALLAGGQIALSLVLVVGAGLLLRSFANLVSEDPGFQAEQVLTARMTPPKRAYPTDSARAALLMRVIERVRTIPGVVEAGGANLLPIVDLGAGTYMAVEGRPVEPVVTDRPAVEVRMATGGYFRAMGIPLRRGTLIRGDEQDAGENAIVINEALAREYFAGRDPIGRTITIAWDRQRVGRIVGVVGDVRHKGLDSASRPMTYWAPQQMVGFNEMALVMRLAPGAGAVAEALRREVQAVDPNVPLGEIAMMDVHLAESVARRRLTMSLVTAFGLIAVLLAAVGIYGVVAYGVAQRTREFGLRLALGAQSLDVTRLVLGEGFILAAASVGVGIAGALALTRVLRSALYEVTPTDPLVFAAAVALLVGIALLASWLPARRASRVDPAVALRAD